MSNEMTESWKWEAAAGDRIVLTTRRMDERGQPYTWSDAVIWFGGNTKLRDEVLADHAAASRQAELQAELEGFHAELAKVGLDGASAEVLVRHHRNNEAATQGAWKHVAERLQEELDAARAEAVHDYEQWMKVLAGEEAISESVMADLAEVEAENATLRERAALADAESQRIRGIPAIYRTASDRSFLRRYDALAATSPAVENAT